MLVMADGVQTVLVLSPDVTLQSLQDAVRLQDLGVVEIQLLTPGTKTCSATALEYSTCKVYSA